MAKLAKVSKSLNVKTDEWNSNRSVRIKRGCASCEHLSPPPLESVIRCQIRRPRRFELRKLPVPAAAATACSVDLTPEQVSASPTAHR